MLGRKAPIVKPSFIAYIDESGDEGFVFNEDGSGSSRWFVLSAAVIREADDLQMVSGLKEVRELLKKPPRTPLHFVDLKHEQRVPYARRVGALPIRILSVLIHKPLITEPEKFQNTKYLLYRYATRMLLERISWLCRDQRKAGEGDGFSEVIFPIAATCLTRISGNTCNSCVSNLKPIRSKSR